MPFDSVSRKKYDVGTCIYLIDAYFKKVARNPVLAAVIQRHPPRLLHCDPACFGKARVAHSVLRARGGRPPQTTGPPIATA